MKIFILFIPFFILSCATARLQIPQEWTVSVKERSGCGPFGMCFLKKRQIEVYPPWWLPAHGKSEGSYSLSERAIITHELAHAWGLKGCNRPWCLMYEPDRTGCSPDNRIVEMLAKPLQLLFGFRFCSKCRKYLEQMNAFSSESE
ncbi:MAG: hypothetical protein ACMUJM_23185 [bacterium]